jgi:hypothetical protein
MRTGKRHLICGLFMALALLHCGGDGGPAEGTTPVATGNPNADQSAPAAQTGDTSSATTATANFESMRLMSVTYSIGLHCGSMTMLNPHDMKTKMFCESVLPRPSVSPVMFENEVVAAVNSYCMGVQSLGAVTSNQLLVNKTATPGPMTGSSSGAGYGGSSMTGTPTAAPDGTAQLDSALQQGASAAALTIQMFCMATKEILAAQPPATSATQPATTTKPVVVGAPQSGSTSNTGGVATGGGILTAK